MKALGKPRSPFSLYWLLLWLVLFSWQCAAYSGHKELFSSSKVLAPTATIAVAPYNSQAKSPSALPPSMAPDSLVPLLPSSPMYPFLPNGSEPDSLNGLCNLNFSIIAGTLNRTAGDCTSPLAEYVGNVICCPQFRSMLNIFKGMLSLSSGVLALNTTEASKCLSEAAVFLSRNGANVTVTELCSLEVGSLTRGACPIIGAEEFETLVNTASLLGACSSVDPLKECCRPVCLPAITDAAVRLASRSSANSLALNTSSRNASLRQVVDDCRGVVLSWLASQLDADVANKVFRNLLSCDVNKVCPLAFDNVSNVVESCGGQSPSKSTCCSSLYHYISNLQQQMFITNLQALECVTLFGSMLKKKGVTANIYDLCHVDLKDFSLQVVGEQGCLLRAIPTDVVYDYTSGISFTCDLNDNIAAPWPLSSSSSSFPLCASSNDSLSTLLSKPKTSNGLGVTSAMVSLGYLSFLLLCMLNLLLI